MRNWTPKRPCSVSGAIRIMASDADRLARKLAGFGTQIATGDRLTGLAEVPRKTGGSRKTCRPVRVFSSDAENSTEALGRDIGIVPPCSTELRSGQRGLACVEFAAYGSLVGAVTIVITNGNARSIPMITHQAKQFLSCVAMIPTQHDEDGGLERRIAPRSSVLDSRCLIGWFEDGKFIPSEARLLDISSAGAAVEAGSLPPDGRDIGLCLIGGPDLTPILGEVVGIGARPKGRYLVRMAFWMPCPRHLLAFALHGAD